MGTARQAWLAAHPFLDGIARFHGMVEEAAARGPERSARAPRPEARRADEEAGVPLLLSASAGEDFAPAAGEALADLAEALAGEPLPGRLGEACREIREALRRSPAERERAIAWIVAGAAADGAPPNAGLLKLLAWTAARRVLAPIVRRPAAQEDADLWGRGRCPTCGALPSMAQLVPGEAARPRLLACACCGTRWRWRRIGCPFCDGETSDRLGVLQLEGCDAVRIDFCTECGGYLKTYTDEGEEDLFLADWPTLHLDVVARKRGLRRLGASLYDLPTDEERRTEPWPTEC